MLNPLTSAIKIALPVMIWIVCYGAAGAQEFYTTLARAALE